MIGATASREPPRRRPSLARRGLGSVGLALVLGGIPEVAAETPTDTRSTVSAPAKPPPSLADLEKGVPTVSGYAQLHYSQLAGFKFQPPPQPHPPGQPPPEVLAQVPAAIRKFDGKKVALTGYMLPLKLENGLATEFFFLSNPTLCCYGVIPEVNEWMLVKMRGEGLPAVQDVPMFLAGRLQVRARWEAGFLLGIYELEGHGLLKPRP